MSLAATSFGLSAFAADGTTYTQSATDKAHSITITKKDNEEHIFQAYQIFSGVLTGTKEDKTDEKAVMTEIKWGANVNTGKIADALAALEEGNPIKAALADLKNPADATQFAAFISANSGTSGFAEAIADLFNGLLTGNPAGAVTINKDAESKDGVISELATGYYLVKDKAGSLAGKNGAYSDFVLQLVNNVKVTAKADAPSIDKNILDGTTKKKGDTASIGDVINYQLDSAVPDMAGYNKYFFIVNDKMSKGLEFQSVSEITVGKTTLTKDTDYTVTSEKLTADDPATEDIDENGMTAVKIVFKGFYEKFKDHAGDPIAIKYSAILDDDCDRTVAGNPNVVDLTFSNDPNFKYEGTPGTPGNPDEPGPTEPTGKTPEAKTKVYTTAIRIKKVDETGKPLTGAKFTISGTALNKVITETSAFAADEAGTYYKLKNGSYTETAPTEDTADKYDGDTKYKLTTTDSTAVTVSDKEAGLEVAVDSEGYIIFSGLGDGEYTIKESEAPKGYNIDASEYSVKITGTPTFDAPTGRSTAQTQPRPRATAGL
jgi:fimbrial isopeptide formation D2 family protein